MSITMPNMPAVVSAVLTAAQARATVAAGGTQTVALNHHAPSVAGHPGTVRDPKDTPLTHGQATPPKGWVTPA